MNNAQNSRQRPGLVKGSIRAFVASVIKNYFGEIIFIQTLRHHS